MMRKLTSIYFMFVFLLTGYNTYNKKEDVDHVTCENSYIYTNLTNKSWLNPTANRFYAHYTPYRLHYNVGHVVRFSCSPGKYFQRALGMTRGESKCLPDSRWSLEWPMCKGHTCDRLRIPDAVVDDEDIPLPPGTTVNIRCWEGFHLWGDNQSTCTNKLQWTHHRYLNRPRECVTIERFKYYCDSALFTFRKNPESGKPECVGDHNPQPLDDTIYTRRIILGTSVPVSTLFFIVVFISCLYARRFRAYQDRMAAAVHFQNTDNSIHLVLPSYDDALKSKPTTPPPLYSEEESSPMLQSPQEVTVATSEFPPAYTT